MAIRKDIIVTVTVIVIILNMYIYVCMYKYNAYSAKYLSSKPLMDISSSSSQIHLYRESTGRSNGYSKAFETKFNDVEISEILLY